jgi:hypothetical protein
VYVYFIRSAGKPTRVKIGKSRDPKARLKELQTGSPYPLDILGTIKCRDQSHADRLEKELHRYFATYRKNGEWFKCGMPVLVKIWELLNKVDETLSQQSVA